MRTRALITVAAVTALTACSPGTAEPSAQPEETPLTCETPSQELLDFIADGAEASTGGITITRGSAYKSPNYEKVWFVAAEFNAPGVDNEVAVWATNSLAGEGLTLAVDNMAQEFTVYPNANETSFEIPTTGDDVTNAKGCLDQTS